MSHLPHEPLRELTEAERTHLSAVVRATSERADVRQRAVLPCCRAAVLAVGEGQSYTAAAQRAGSANGAVVSRLVHRVTQRGLAALALAPGRGRKPAYAAAERQQILDPLQQTPERTNDQRATWSLTLLQRRLRAHGLPQVSRATIHKTVRGAGSGWQRSRTWCPTGTARRQRQAGVVSVTDPEAERKKG